MRSRRARLEDETDDSAFLPTLRDKFLLGDGISISADSSEDEDGSSSGSSEVVFTGLQAYDGTGVRSRHKDNGLILWTEDDPRNRKHIRKISDGKRSGSEESLWHLDESDDHPQLDSQSYRSVSPRSTRESREMLEASEEDASVTSFDSDEDINLLMAESSSSGMSYDELDTDTDSDDFVMYDAFISASVTPRRDSQLSNTWLPSEHKFAHSARAGLVKKQDKAIRPVDLLLNKTNRDTSSDCKRKGGSNAVVNEEQKVWPNSGKIGRNRRPLMGAFRHATSPKVVVDGKSPVPAKLPKWLKGRQPRRRHRPKATQVSSPRYGNATVISLDEILDFDGIGKKLGLATSVGPSDTQHSVTARNEVDRWERIPIGAFKRAQGIDAHETSAVWSMAEEDVTQGLPPRQRDPLSSMLCVTKRRKGADALSSPMLMPLKSRHSTRALRGDRGMSQRRSRPHSPDTAGKAQTSIDSNRLPSAGLSYTVSPLFTEHYLQNVSPSFPPLDDAGLETR